MWLPLLYFTFLYEGLERKELLSRSKIGNR